jgi:hypothetical protein
MNFDGMTMVPAMWTSIRTRDGEHVADAFAHPMMAHGEPLEIEGRHWLVAEATVFTTADGRRQELVVEPALEGSPTQAES